MISKFSSLSFYVVAHADDWQLFMFPEVYNDIINPNIKTVLIITTAGDAGKHECYWKAREEGCKSSARLCVAALDEPVEFENVTDIFGKKVTVWSIHNLTCYFLRLPDGNIDGNGFMTNKNESLEKLLNNKVDCIHSLDQETFTKPQLLEVVKGIVDTESSGINFGRINFPNPDSLQNPNDHSDHIATGKLVQLSIAPVNFQMNLYTGYHSQHSSEFLSPEQIFWKSGIFSAYQNTVQNISGYNTLSENTTIYINWCLRRSVFISFNN